MQARMLLVASVLLAVGVLALPNAAPAKLPTKPACAAVSARLLQATFGFRFSTHWRATKHQTTRLQHLRCVYRSAEGELSIAFDRYSSAKAARAHYRSFRKSLIRRGNSQPPDSITQLLPLVRLRGIGDRAFRSTDGTAVAFVDGIDSVTLEHGFADLGGRTTRGMVSLARRLDRAG